VFCRVFVCCCLGVLWSSFCVSEGKSGRKTHHMTQGKCVKRGEWWKERLVGCEGVFGWFGR